MKKIVRKRVLLPVAAALFLIVGSSFKSDFFEIAKQIEIFTTLFKELNMNYVDETSPAELMDSAIKNMLDGLDPYTAFLNEQDVESFKINNTGEYSGIGALVRNYKDKIVVIEPYQGYPADKAGLKAGDEIIKIGDLPVSEAQEEADELLKGANNTSIAVTFIRQGQTKTATIIRSAIEIDAVPYYKMINAQTGYIVLSKFNQKATAQTQEALINLKNEGAKNIILDLRDNPGGLLTEAINITNLFIPKGEVVVTTKSKVKKFNQVYKTTKQPVDVAIPLAVLINGRSASASEIVSGSLQDLDRAVIVGARSFGKGLVQRPIRLAYGTQLKVTISRYYTASGRCIQSLDYWNQDENGKAKRNTQFASFKTKNGREVQDGGGILPDIEVTTSQTNLLTQALLTQNIIFDYATNYYYQHPLNAVSDFKFGENDFNSFKTYVDKSGFLFETQAEKALKEAMTGEESALFGPAVTENYHTLLASLEKSKTMALDRHKTEIVKNLEDEILKRYFYREGLYDFHLQNDEAILTASSLLNDAKKYQEILK